MIVKRVEYSNENYERNIHHSAIFTVASDAKSTATPDEDVYFSPRAVGELKWIHSRSARHITTGGCNRHGANNMGSLKTGTIFWLITEGKKCVRR